MSITSNTTRKLAVALVVAASIAGVLPLLPTATSFVAPAGAQLPATCLPQLSVRRASMVQPSTLGNDTSFDPAMAADGNRVAFSSFASNLIGNDTNGRLDSYVTDLGTGAVSRASVGVGGVQGNGAGVSPSLDADGSIATFYSDSTNLIGGDGNDAAGYSTGGYTILPFGMLAVNPTTTLELWFRTTGNGPILGYADVAPDNTPTQYVPVLYVGTDGKLRGQFWNGAVAPLTSTGTVNDGRWHQAVLTVGSGVFQALYVDTVLQDFKAGQINHLSMFLATIGRAFNTGYPLAGTGWRSFPGDIDEVSVFWGDTFDQNIINTHYAARTTSYRMTVLGNTPDGYWRLAESSTSNVAADASGNNRSAGYVNTVSRGRPGALTVDQNFFTDVFLRDLSAGTTERVSVGAGGIEGAGGDSLFADVSGDGRYVTFNSSATNLVAGDSNARSDIFVRDRVAAQTTRVSVGPSNAQGTVGSTLPVISADGRYVAFSSNDNNLVTGDNNGRTDIFVRDRVAGTTTRVSTSTTGAQATDDSLNPDISADGRYVTFYSFANNLVTGDSNNVADVFVKDRTTGAITRVNVRTGGLQASGASSFSPAISGNGRYVSFTTAANNLVTGDNNGVSDVFVHDRSTGETTRMSVSAARVQANGASDAFSDGVLSNTGLQLAYGSVASNIVTPDSNALSDVYVANQGVIESTEITRFINLWLPRLNDIPFVQSLLDAIGYPVTILSEGFHSLTDAAKHLLADCLASTYLDTLTSIPMDLRDEYLTYLQETLYTFIFDKANLGGQERVSAAVNGVLTNPLIQLLAAPVLAALPATRIPNLLAPGVLTTSSLLGGHLLFDDDPVDGIADTLRSFAPALPPLPNLTHVLAGLSDAVDELAVAPLLFQLLGSITYGVKVERYSTTGTKLGEINESGYVPCVPTTLSSSGGRLALTPHDLRVNLCPDPLSLLGAADQKIFVVADALNPNVRVRITYTLNTLLAGINGQLQVAVDASTKNLPVESGAGSTAAFPCNQNTVPPVLPLGVGETRQGVCVALTANGANPANGTNTITTYSSGPITGVDVHLNSFAGTTVVPAGDVSIVNVPDADAHTVTVAAQTPTALNGNQITARVALTNVEANVVNLDEDLVVHQYDPQGRLAAALTVADVQDALDATLTAPLDAGGNPTALRLAGTAQASPLTTYRLEQFAPNGTATAHLRISGLAPAYDFRAAIIHDAQMNADVGAEVTGSFPQGPSAGGELYLKDTTRGAELLVRDFATTTSFTATVDNPADPQEFALSLDNSESRPSQVVRVVQTPTGATPIRLLLAGTAANPAEFPDPSAGRTLRWTAIPRSLDLTAALTRQPNGDPAAVTFDTSGTDAPSAGLIELRDHRPTEALVLRILSPSVAQHVSIEAEGPLANPSRIRLARDNGAARSTHGLQLVVYDALGLRAQLAFTGATADLTRLLPGPAREIDAIATNVASQAYSYELAITPGAGSIPAAATITGTNVPSGVGTDVVLTDARSGLRMHQRNLPTSFTYALRTETDSVSGDVSRAIIQAVNQASAMPTALLELGFGALQAVFAGFTQTFTYDFNVDGPLDDPNGVTVDITQSAANPDLLIQLAKGSNGTVADFSATFRNNATPTLPLRGTNADLQLVGVPQNLTTSLTIDQPAADRLAATVVVDRHGVDGADATLRIRRTDGTSRQELRYQGLGPQMSTRLALDGTLSAPRRARVEAFRTVVHPTDALQLLVYESNVLRQRMHLRATPLGGPEPPGSGDEPGPVPGLTGADTNVAIGALPEGITLEQTVCSNFGATDGSCVDGSSAADGRERLGLAIRTYDAGATLAVPPVLLRTGARIDASVRNPVAGADARVITLEQLPASMDVRYLGPVPNPTATDNCIGDISYTASDSQLDLNLTQTMGVVRAADGSALGNGCFGHVVGDPDGGRLQLAVTNMPSLGFEVATMRRDGSATFRTRNPGSGRQVVGRAQISAPVPDWVAAFVNDEIDVDERVCDFAVGCIYFDISANPEFVELRLDVDAISLSDAEVRTNVGAGGDAKPVPAGFNQVNTLMWNLLPILGVRNATGSVLVHLSGDDAPTVGNSLSVHIGCCLRGISTANHDLDLSFDVYHDLQLAFYGWDAQQLLAPAGGIVKFDRNDQEIGDGISNQYRAKIPFTGDTDVPFGPRFIEYPLARDPATGLWDPTRSNLFEVPANTTSYFLPNLYDVFASEPVVPGDPSNVRRERWYARAPVYQTNWYWYALLHRMETDPLGFYQ